MKTLIAIISISFIVFLTGLQAQETSKTNTVDGAVISALKKALKKAPTTEKNDPFKAGIAALSTGNMREQLKDSIAKKTAGQSKEEAIEKLQSEIRANFTPEKIEEIRKTLKDPQNSIKEVAWPACLLTRTCK